MSYKNFNQPCVFIAKWSRHFGPKVLEFQPDSIEIDLETIAMQIFIAYQNFYYDEKKKIINRILFKLPIKNIKRRSKILLDSLDKTENVDNPQAFIIGLLLPDYSSDDMLEKFDNILINIGEEFSNTKTLLLNSYYEEINELFIMEQKVQDSEMSLAEDYSFPNALLDFKQGIKQFTKKNYHPAYFLLKKAYLKFKNENKLDLILETSFALGSVLTQLQKYDAARHYYLKLEELASQLQHKKYYETSLFMAGVCAYKNLDYIEAIKKFSKLETMDLQFINKFNYFFLYGQILRVLEKNAKAITILLKALQISEDMEKSEEIQEKRAKILLELGHTNYNMAIVMRNSGKVDEKTLKTFLNNSIDYYKTSIEIYETINRYSNLISNYQLIGNIYEYLEDFKLSLESYKKALEYSETSNDIVNRLKSFKLIIQTLVDLELHEVIVKEIDEMLSKIVSYAFLDLHTISGFHGQLGESLHKLGKSKEALSELIIALNIYNKFETPVQESLETLQKIIDIYKESGDQKYIQYYQDQYTTINDELKELTTKKKINFGLIGEVREIWIFMNMGKQLFAHAPETKFNPQLFGGFLSALTNFSMELASNKLTCITIGSGKYTFYRSEDRPIFILSRSNITTSMNFIEKMLPMIYDEFWKQYQPFLENFDDDITRFANFEDILYKLDFSEIIN